MKKAYLMSEIERFTLINKLKEVQSKLIEANGLCTGSGHETLFESYNMIKECLEILYGDN